MTSTGASLPIKGGARILRRTQDAVTNAPIGRKRKHDAFTHHDAAHILEQRTPVQIDRGHERDLRHGGVGNFEAMGRMNILKLSAAKILAEAFADAVPGQAADELTADAVKTISPDDGQMLGNLRGLQTFPGRQLRPAARCLPMRGNRFQRRTFYRAVQSFKIHGGPERQKRRER